MSVVKFTPPAADPVRFLERIEGLEVFRTARMAADAEQTKRRQALVKSIVDAEAKHSSTSSALARRVTATQEILAGAQAAFAAAQNAAAVALHAQREADIGLQVARNWAEGQLRTDADVAAIQSFRSWALDELERTRKKFSFNSTQVRHPITGHATVKTVNNKASVQARVQGIRAAMDIAEQQLLEPDQTVVRERLVALADGLPAVEDVK